ncbi:hypothetical protein M5689_024691 [Euphorbia peplus]|nr:hypothetical protein M5689_024691 [Euphorbia peplus]
MSLRMGMHELAMKRNLVHP